MRADESVAPARRRFPTALSSARAQAFATGLPLALLATLALGVILRAFTIGAYRPAVMTNQDTMGYVGAASERLFADAVRPAGYSFFLRILHAVSSDLTFTIVVQHLLGIVSATLLYLTVRHVGGSRLVAVIPAAAVALSGDQISLEHAVLSEAPFTALLCAVAYASVRILDSPRAWIWAIAAGGLLAGAATVRTVAAPLIPLLALWIALAMPGARSIRLFAAGTSLLAAVAVLGTYSGFQHRSEGTWNLWRSSGWGLYSRVAPFADCSDFTPPSGTRFLCESNRPEERSGPDFYGWGGGPARTAFGAPPAGNETLQRFARAVVIHQPVAYTKTVAKDTLRYFVPSFGFDRASSGSGPDLYLLDRRAGIYESWVEDAVESYYQPFDLKVDPSAVRALTNYQELVRVHGIILLQFFLVALVGLLYTAGKQRRALIFLTAFGFLLLLVPAATTSYHARYAVPAEGIVAAAAAIGGAAILRRLQRPAAPGELSSGNGRA